MSPLPPSSQGPPASAGKGTPSAAKKRAGWREAILAALEAKDGEAMKKSADVITEILQDKNHDSISAAWRVMLAITQPATAIDGEVLEPGDVVIVRCRMNALEAAEARERAAGAAPVDTNEDDEPEAE